MKPMNYKVPNIDKDKRNKEYFERMHFSPSGDCYIVLGNTYEIKDELKRKGAHFNRVLGWYFSEPNSEYECAPLHKEDFMTEDWGLWIIDDEKAEKLIKEIRDEYVKFNSKSEYVGEIGQKYSGTLKLVDIFTFTSNYSYYGEFNGIYKFEDNQGNIIVWKTAFKDDLEEGNLYEISGVIKDHSEYRGEKQTALTRCKYKEIK